MGFMSPLVWHTKKHIKVGASLCACPRAVVFSRMSSRGGLHSHLRSAPTYHTTLMD